MDQYHTRDLFETIARGEHPSWTMYVQIMRTAFETHAEDDDFGQVGTLVRTVMDDAARDRLAANTVAQLRNGVTEPALQRAFGYLRNVDQSYGDKVEKGVRGGQA